LSGPQSGRSSAVGFAMESSFGNVPLTPISGSVYSVGISGTNPNRFFIVEPGGGYDIDAVKDIGTDEQDGDFETHRITLTGKNYPGDDTFKIDPENLYYPLLGLFGRDVETSLGGGAYRHAFTHQKYMPSFTQEEQFGDATNGRLSAAVVFDSINITHSAVLMAKINYHAHRQIPNRYPGPGGTDVDYDFTSTAGLLPSQLGGDHTKQTKLTVVPGYVDVAEGNCGNGPLVYANSRTGTAVGFSNTFITLNDVAYDSKILSGWTLDLVRNIESHMVAGSGFDPSAPVANEFTVSGKMDVLFTDNTIPQATLSNCKFGINMVFQGAQIGSSGFYYTYEVYLPRIKFLKANMRRVGKSLMTGGNFYAEKDASLGYSVKVTIQNSYTHASLAGTQPQLGGGLGGWVAA